VFGTGDAAGCGGGGAAAGAAGGGGEVGANEAYYIISPERIRVDTSRLDYLDRKSRGNTVGNYRRCAPCCIFWKAWKTSNDHPDRQTCRVSHSAYHEHLANSVSLSPSAFCPLFFAQLLALDRASAAIIPSLASSAPHPC
jgi:hypothetical protein